MLYTLIGIKDKMYPNDPFIEKYTYTPLVDEDSLLKTMINQIYFDFTNKINSIDKIHQTKLTILSLFSLAKFNVLNKLLENDFCKKELKEKLLNKFCKAQKMYYAFIKVANIYRHKFYKTVVDKDLSLNLLDKNNSSNVITIIHNNSKYLFSLNDIVKIVENSISNSPNFFATPLWPVNPYCRQPFLFSDLCNTYFLLKKSSMIMSTLFHCFFLSKFELKAFEMDYECLIREFSIKKYVYCSPYTVLYNSILRMLETNRFTKLLIIHQEFPKDKLVQIFRPFLYYYYIVNYYIHGTNKIYEYNKLLNYKLRKFYEYNKLFGRKFYKLTYINNSTKTRKIVKQKLFNDKHLSFNSIKLDYLDGDSESNNNYYPINHFTFRFYLDNQTEPQPSRSESESESESDYDSESRTRSRPESRDESESDYDSETISEFEHESQTDSDYDSDYDSETISESYSDYDSETISESYSVNECTDEYSIEPSQETYYNSEEDGYDSVS